MDEEHIEILNRYIEISESFDPASWDQMALSEDVQRAMTVMTNQLTPQTSTLVATLCYHAGMMNAYGNMAVPLKRKTPPH